MNVTIENVGPCKNVLRVEMDGKSVAEALETALKEAQKHIAVPGFRKGKAPREVILKQYGKEIEGQAKEKMLKDTFSAAVKEKNVTVVNSSDLKEGPFNATDGYHYTVTIETAPTIELPEYKGLPAKRSTKEVTDADVDKALEMLRNQQASHEKVDRAAQENDFLVVNYTGSCEGKPILEVDPEAKSLNEQKNFWVQIGKDQFLPGFAEQMSGAKAGDKRTVTVDFPADFPAAPLVNKKGVFEVEVLEVRQRNLPTLDDAFAKTLSADSFETLKKGVRSDLQNELNYRRRADIRNQVMTALLARVTCDLPESDVQSETKNVVYDIVNENQRRGIPKELIEKEKDNIYKAATIAAQDRVKASYIFQKIAEKEGLKPTQEEMNHQIISSAAAYEMSPEKFAKELQKRGGLGEIYEQVLSRKIVDFLVEYAKVEEVAEEPKA